MSKYFDINFYRTKRPPTTQKSRVKTTTSPSEVTNDEISENELTKNELS